MEIYASHMFYASFIMRGKLLTENDDYADFTVEGNLDR